MNKQPRDGAGEEAVDEGLSEDAHVWDDEDGVQNSRAARQALGDRAIPSWASKTTPCTLPPW